MKRLILLETAKLRKVVILLFGLFCIYSIALPFLFKSGYVYHYHIEIWEEAYSFILFFLPVFCTIPFSWLLYHERKNGFIAYSLIRTNRKQYLCSKLIVHCIGGFLITFCMSMLGLLVALYLTGPLTVYEGIESHLDVFQLNFFISHPLLYGLFLSLWRALLSLLFVIFSFLCSLLFSNLFLILILPFIYYLSENIILSMLSLEQYRMVVSLGVIGVTGGVQVWHLLFGPLLLLIMNLILFFIGMRRKIFSF